MTTDTAHHRYFLRRLVAELPNDIELVLNVFETKGYPWGAKRRRHIKQSLPNVWRAFALNPYRPSSALDKAQAEFEEPAFFPDGDRALPDGLASSRFHSVNDAECVEALEQAAPDLLLVYGTGKINAPVFELAPLGAVNAHGGALPAYRGLDANLWAAYEGRPDDMAVTLHSIDVDIDTGPIYETRPIGKIAGLCLANFRYHTSVLCTDMFMDVIKGIAAGTTQAFPQSGEGRYFGPMPTRLKLRAEKMFQSYCAD